jgi:single-stranded-DNA-specific exonuclease
VERYGVPVFIGTYEGEEEDAGTRGCGDAEEEDRGTRGCGDAENLQDDSPRRRVSDSPRPLQGGDRIRGSARGIPEFHVFEALEFCADLLGKFGGHKAAGGFSLSGENLEKLRSRLRTFAHQCLQPEHLKPVVKIDAQASLEQVNLDLYRQIDALHPCGIENSDPVFWTPNLRVFDQQIVGKGHIKLTLVQDITAGEQVSSWGEENYQLPITNYPLPITEIKAIAWRWRDYFPLPSRLDIAYRLQQNNWNGSQNIELQLVGVRLPQHLTSPQFNGKNLTAQVFTPLVFPTIPVNAAFYYKQRRYTCGLFENGSDRELRIRNSAGKILAIKPGKTTGLLGMKREESEEVDISQPGFERLIQAALAALAVAEQNVLVIGNG